MIGLALAAALLLSASPPRDALATDVGNACECAFTASLLRQALEATSGSHSGDRGAFNRAMEASRLVEARAAAEMQRLDAITPLERRAEMYALSLRAIENRDRLRGQYNGSSANRWIIGLSTPVRRCADLYGIPF